MKNQLRNRTLIMVLAAVVLAGSTVAPVQAAQLSLFKSKSVSSQPASKPTAGPLQGEPETGQSGPLPPKLGAYPTIGPRAVAQDWLAAWRNLLLRLVGRLGD